MSPDKDLRNLCSAPSVLQSPIQNVNENGQPKTSKCMSLYLLQGDIGIKQLTRFGQWPCHSISCGHLVANKDSHTWMFWVASTRDTSH